MRSLLVAVMAIFAAVSSAAAEVALPSEKMALDVIQWVRHGSEKFRGKYADQALFAKKKNIVLYGKVFEKMAKAGDLPKGYSVVTDETLKDVDWSTTGMIAINGELPEGGFGVNIRTSPWGMCGYRIAPQEGLYNVHDNGGS